MKFRFFLFLLLIKSAKSQGSVQRWERLETPPADSILGLKAAFLADPASNKIELTIGAYRESDGKPYVLPSVQKARQWLGSRPSEWLHEYLPIEGLSEFLHGSENLLFGNLTAMVHKVSCQALSGTGAVRLVFEFLVRHYQASKTIYIPAITWANHWNIARDAGLSAIPYRYLVPGSTNLDVQGLLDDLRTAPQNSIVLLHLCAHNPTGVDPDRQTWIKIAEIIAQNHLFPIFDSAYLGFASGDVDNDAYPFRLFVEKGLMPWACVSFSKNFGLYSERVGAVHATLGSMDESPKVLGHLKKIARAMYSNPPAFGARLVAHILNDPTLKTSWQHSLGHMAERISMMRAELRKRLEKQLKAHPKYSDWSHVTSQIGMFSFTGLEPHHVQALRHKHHIYILDNGRISMAGLNHNNLQQFADAVVDVLTDAQIHNQAMPDQTNEQNIPQNASSEDASLGLSSENDPLIIKEDEIEQSKEEVQEQQQHSMPDL